MSKIKKQNLIKKPSQSQQSQVSDRLKRLEAEILYFRNKLKEKEKEFKEEMKKAFHL